MASFKCCFNENDETRICENCDHDGGLWFYCNENGKMMTSFKIEPLCDELKGLLKMVKVTHPESPSLTVDVNGQLCHSVAPSSRSCQQTLTGLRETCVVMTRLFVFSPSVVRIQTARQVAIASCAVRGARHRFLLLLFFFFGNSTALIREMGKHSIYFGTESIYFGMRSIYFGTKSIYSGTDSIYFGIICKLSGWSAHSVTTKTGPLVRFNFEQCISFKKFFGVV